MELWSVDDTTLTIHDHLPEPVRLALCEWLVFHGGDPNQVPMISTLTRLVDECAVEVDVFQLTDDGRRTAARDEHGDLLLDEHGSASYVRIRARLQGETAPLPWPSVLVPPTPDPGA
jgi:hypothetical protein